ncbi:hypothetical protein BTO20_14865 [Mycobacterium dioxanotrophicus]|uniref:Uncharacterized protein n=1 Tax=Mycobacterium dioxanotrophicus TaxID=482462 RepID=A0A1Y0C3C5_9MYCO|nr:hypothetical protein [Mycobacterium dioxanotrophicus]ART69700.1 hypothetical protein BTO20_14865 [Mycobacterium dioxanotrophicus]
MRVGIVVRSPDGQILEAAILLPLDGPETYSPELNDQLEDILIDSLRDAGLSTPEPVIQASDVPHLGGHWVPGPADIEFLVSLVLAVPLGVAANTLSDALKPRLRQRFGARPNAAHDVALRAEMRAMLASDGDQMARTQIEGMFGVPGSELEAVSAGLSGSNGLYIYRGQDGSQFTVNVDIEDGFFLHVIRNWPGAPSAPAVEESSGDGGS